LTTVSCTAVLPATDPRALHMASISSSIMICSLLIFPHYKNTYFYTLCWQSIQIKYFYLPALYPQLHTTPTATDHTHSYRPHSQLQTTLTATDHTHN